MTSTCQSSNMGLHWVERFVTTPFLLFTLPSPSISATKRQKLTLKYLFYFSAVQRKKLFYTSQCRGIFWDCDKKMLFLQFLRLLVKIRIVRISCQFQKMGQTPFFVSQTKVSKTISFVQGDTRERERERDRERERSHSNFSLILSSIIRQYLDPEHTKRTVDTLVKFVEEGLCLGDTFSELHSMSSSYFE